MPCEAGSNVEVSDGNRMLSEYEAAKLAKDARREPYPSLASVWAAVIGTVILIAAAALSEAPAPAADVAAMPPRVSPAIAHSRELYEERRARFEQARSGGAQPLPKSYSAATAGGQELADQQADAAGNERPRPPAR
jgi:hypothetical protein